MNLVEDISREAESLNKETVEGVFPISALPEKLQQISAQTCKNLYLIPDFLNAGIIGAASAAIGATHRINIKTGYSQSAAVNLCLVGIPGFGKSPALDWAINPISEENSALIKSTIQKLTEYEKSMRKVKHDTDEREILIKPKREQLLTKDATLEALTDLLKDNPRGVSIHADELAGLMKNMNRYNSGSDLETYLSIFNNASITINRKKDFPIQVDKPYVSILGTIQPGILKELYKDGKRENGFTDRVLFSFPDHIPDYVYSLDSAADQYPEYRNIITRLLRLDFKDPETNTPHFLSISDEGKREAMNYINRCWSLKQANKHNEELCGIVAKIEIYVYRLSLVCHLLSWACGEAERDEVSLKSVQSAIKITDYFFYMAKKVLRFSAVGSNPLGLNEIQMKLYDLLPDTFSRSDCQEIAKPLSIAVRTLDEWLKKGLIASKINYDEYRKKVA